MEDFTNKYPSTPEATTALNMLDTLEEESWQNAVAINDFASLKLYLDEYPQGKYIKIAAFRMDSINRLDVIVPIDTPILIEETTPPNPTQNGGRNQVARPSTPSRNTRPRNQQPSQRPNTRPTNSGTTRPSTNGNTTTTTPQSPSTSGNNHPPTTDPNRPVLLPNAARKPVFRKCGNSDRKREEQCTAKGIHSLLSNQIQYPEEAKRRGIEGKIVVSFVVEKDGSITDVKALNKIGGGCEDEAIRLVKKLPKFTPGKNAKGNPIRVQYTQPVTFKIEK
ncbi:MAG: TonB family protein [Saprospiraceae bacterium]|nr:TonB family protein [Saprospiraceae bacterium]